MAKEDDSIDDRELSTRELKPPEFPPSVPASDLEDFNNRDKKLLLGFYVIAQKVDWLIAAVIETNKNSREMEREIIRLRRWRKKLVTRWTIISGIIMFVVTIFFSGLLGQMAQAIGAKLFNFPP